MLIYAPPPAQQATQPTAELPLLPGSDPMLLGVYQWTLAHSPSLRQLIDQLARTDQKARYRLIQGLGKKYSLLITPTNQNYDITIEVPILAWRQCGDALEAWIASSLFMALDVVKNERYRETGNLELLVFREHSISASFTFQDRVKRELAAADPERLKDLPDGAHIYATHFEPTRYGSRKQRWLPGTLPEAAAQKEAKVVAAAVAVEDRPITLPPLPQDAAQGHAQFKVIHGQIGNALADLSRALPALYARPEGQNTLPATLSIPPEGMAEATTLLEVIQGREFRRLERAYLDTWKGWQAALVEGGVAQPLQAPERPAKPDSKEYLAAKERAQQVLAEPSRRFGPGNRLDATITRQEHKRGLASKLDAGYLDDLELPPNKGGYAIGKDDTWLPEELQSYIKAENAVVASLKEQAVAGQVLGQLSETWAPLMDHLNTAAKRILDQERSPDLNHNAALKALRVHARLAVLERFRKALWYCDLVWCQVASAESPPPPPRLSPAAPVPAPHP